MVAHGRIGVCHCCLMSGSLYGPPSKWPIGKTCERHNSSRMSGGLMGLFLVGRGGGLAQGLSIRLGRGEGGGAK